MPLPTSKCCGGCANYRRGRLQLPGIVRAHRARLRLREERSWKTIFFMYKDSQMIAILKNRMVMHRAPRVPRAPCEAHTLHLDHPESCCECCVSKTKTTSEMTQMLIPPKGATCEIE